MDPMSATVTWTDVAVRLALTVIAGVMLGYNRGEHGKAAGMRTMLLVCLAASIAMLQVNVLLPLAGRAANSFVMNDLMRLPLGILTGVGFIGGGVILRRGSTAIGVTTAATLWLVTVIGLCFGGGQIALGLAATIIGLFGLWVLQWFEHLLRHEQPASLAVELDPDGPDETAIRRALAEAGLWIVGSRVALAASGRRTLSFELREMRRFDQHETPGLVHALARQPGVVKLTWHTG